MDSRERMQVIKSEQLHAALLAMLDARMNEATATANVLDIAGRTWDASQQRDNERAIAEVIREIKTFHLDAHNMEVLPYWNDLLEVLHADARNTARRVIGAYHDAYVDTIAIVEHIARHVMYTADTDE